MKFPKKKYRQRLIGEAIYRQLHGEYLFTTALKSTKLYSLKRIYHNVLHQQKKETNSILLFGKLNKILPEDMYLVFSGDVVSVVNESVLPNKSERERLNSAINWGVSQLAWLHDRVYRIEQINLRSLFADTLLRQRSVLNSLVNARQLVDLNNSIDHTQ